MKKITAFGETKTLFVKKDTSLNDSKPVFGIDLGTTNSAISIIKDGRYVETIKLKNGKYTMPSCVWFHHNKFIVGDEAYRNRDKEDSVVYSVKRLMQDTKATVTLRDGNETITMTPAEVSAEILKGLVEHTEGMYGKVEDVVVTVPAYFEQSGIDATRKACELAGLNLIGIANEPTAASLCYDIKPEDGNSKDIIVYDLGGGTFDVTLARITMDSSVDNGIADLYGLDSSDEEEPSKVVTTLFVDGDAHLGGDDIDLKTLQSRDDFTFITAHWWVLYHFLKNISFTSNLMVLQETNLLDKLYEKFPTRFKPHMKEIIEYAKEVLLKETIEYSDNLIYARRKPY